ncbi:MAG: integrase arm-type DNA-binding domain-containing protein [Roseiarcus sp.]
MIDEAECPADKSELVVWDVEQPGLLLRVFRGGGKSFWCRYSVAGRKTKFRLGDASAISIKAARDAVRSSLGELAQGRDPAGERKAKRDAEQKKADESAFTLRVLIDSWVSVGLKDARPNYRDEAPRSLKVAFAGRLDRAAADLTDKAVIKVKSALIEAKKDATASALLRYGHAAFAWAISERLVEGNPFAGIKKPSVASRERVLTDEELGAVWRATGGPGSFTAIVRLLMITGQRREEIAGMSWSELSDDLSTFTIPAARSKNGVASIVPLPLPARQIIEGALRRDGVDLVFPGERGVFRNWGHAKKRLDGASGVKGWRLHDLRRTVATNLQALGVRLEVTEAVLSHVSGSRGGIAGVYQRHDWLEEKRAALTAWGEKLGAIIEGRPAADNIHEFRRTSA